MSSFELKSSARKLMVENAPKLFFIGVLYIIVVTIISEFQNRLLGTAAVYEQFLDRVSRGEIPGLATLFSNFKPTGAALAVVLYLMLPIIDVGYMSYCIKIDRRQESDYKDLLDGFLFFGKILLITIVTLVFTLLWSLLLIFPGIAALYRYRQAYYILLDDPSKTVMECIRESKRLMAGNKLDLFLLDLSFAGWYIVNFTVMLLLPFPFPIISVWLTPYIGLTRAGYYNKLIGRLAV